MKKLNVLGVACVMMFIAMSCSNNENSHQTSEVLTQETEPEETEQIADVAESTIIENEPKATEVIETSSKMPTPTKPEPIKTSTNNTKVQEVPIPTTKKEDEVIEKVVIKEKPIKVIENPTPSTVEPIKNTSNKAEKDERPSHAAWNNLLSTYVSATGSVNYAGLKSKEATLDKYLESLSENAAQSNWKRNEKMAYWINLYNAATVKLILENYPTSSINNIAGGKPWDKRWIKAGGKTYTLNEIENSILRPQFNDARIHFAVNCGAVSCPRLMNQAFTDSNLNSLLEQNAKWFINNTTFNTISDKKVEISKIFDWYAADFGDIITFLNKYATTPIKSSAKVTYKDYNWNLNGK